MFVGPNRGQMACGDFGPGACRAAGPTSRRSRAATLAAEAGASPSDSKLQKRDSGPLEGRHVIVTSGPTYEPIDQ